MAVKGVEVKTSPKDLPKKFEKFSKKMGKPFMKNANKKISILLSRWVLLNFRSEGKSVGGWKRLAAGGRYRGRGKKRFFDTSAKILQDKGRLRISFKPFSSAVEAGVGSILPYSEVHEKGAPGKGIPKRRMLPINKEVKFEAMKVVELEFKKEKKKSGIN